MIGYLRGNLVWMASALVLSTALWAVVTFQQNPDEVGEFQQIQVAVQSPPNGLIVRNEVPPVRLLVVAPRDILSQLRPNKFEAVVNASQAAAGVQELPIEVRVLDSRARVERIDPPKALIHLEPIRRREVPVRVAVRGEVAGGYIARQQPRVSPAQVAVTGPQTFVDQVAAVVAEVSLEGVRASINQPVRVVPQAPNGQIVERIAVAPENVVVEITVDQQISYKTVPLVPRLNGSPALGYQIVGIIVDPSSLTIAGEPKVLDEVERLETRPVEVAGATGDLAVNSEPNWPPGVSAARQQNVVVRVYVSPLDASATVDVAPIVQGLPPGYSVSVAPSGMQVTVAGPMPVLSSMKPQDVRATINGAALADGTQPVRPRIELPSPLRVLATNPETVAVTMRPPPTPTPTPLPTATATPAPTPTRTPTEISHGELH